MTDDKPEPRREASAAGGRFHDPANYEREAQAESAWIRAGLLGLLARSADAITAAGALQAKAAEALIALDAGELGTLEDTMFPALRKLMEPMFSATEDAFGFVDELDGVNPAYCTVCGGSLSIFLDQEDKGWQHWRENDVEMSHEIYEPEDGHETKVAWHPRERPAFVNGRVEPVRLMKPLQD